MVWKSWTDKIEHFQEKESKKNLQSARCWRQRFCHKNSQHRQDDQSQQAADRKSSNRLQSEAGRKFEHRSRNHLPRTQNGTKRRTVKVHTMKTAATCKSRVNQARSPSMQSIQDTQRRPLLRKSMPRWKSTSFSMQSWRNSLFPTSRMPSTSKLRITMPDSKMTSFHKSFNKRFSRRDPLKKKSEGWKILLSTIRRPSRSRSRWRRRTSFSKKSQKFETELNNADILQHEDQQEHQKKAVIQKEDRKLILDALVKGK